MTWYARHRDAELARSKARQKLKWAQKCAVTRAALAGLRCGHCGVTIDVAQRRANPRLAFCCKRCRKAAQKQRARDRISALEASSGAATRPVPTPE